MLSGLDKPYHGLQLLGGYCSAHVAVSSAARLFSLVSYALYCTYVFTEGRASR